MHRASAFLLVVVAFAWSAVPVAQSAPAPCPDVLSSTTDPNGINSPYLGHTGANNGEGVDFAGGWPAKLGQLELERDMGLRWTWLNVHWNLVEPEQPTASPPAPIDGTTEPAVAWHRLDRFVRTARSMGLNIALQVVVGGNAGGPPAWAGRRVQDKSAPLFMDGTEPGADGQGLVPFVEKLVQRYRPGGHLATADGWADGYGVRTWLMDNEPDSYQTNWDSVADDYAEFVVKSAAAIKALDPAAVVVAPESNEGLFDDTPFLNAVLEAGAQRASPAYLANGIDYVAGPAIDVPSFHSYEIFREAFPDDADLASQVALTRAVRTREGFAAYEQQTDHEYAPKAELWHTEGGFGFIVDDPEGKKHWIIQWLAQGFAFGVTKMTVMDASPEEARAVRTMTCLLPNPLPIADVTQEVGANSDDAFVFRATRNTDGGSTYVTWARTGPTNGLSPTVTLPVSGDDVKVVSWDGNVSAAKVSTDPTSGAKSVTLLLPGAGAPFNAPVFVVDQPAPSPTRNCMVRGRSKCSR